MLFRSAGKIAVTSQHGVRVDELEAAGADLVLEPFHDAADRAMDLISGRARKSEADRIDPAQDEDGQKEILE